MRIEGHADLGVGVFGHRRLLFDYACASRLLLRKKLETLPPWLSSVGCERWLRAHELTMDDERLMGFLSGAHSFFPICYNSVSISHAPSTFHCTVSY